MAENRFLHQRLTAIVCSVARLAVSASNKSCRLAVRVSLNALVQISKALRSKEKVKDEIGVLRLQRLFAARIQRTKVQQIAGWIDDLSILIINPNIFLQYSDGSIWCEGWICFVFLGV